MRADDTSDARTAAGRVAGSPAGPPAGSTAGTTAGPPAGEAAGAQQGADPLPVAPGDEEEIRPGLTPRQARRVRIVLSAAVMAAVAVALVVRLATAPSVLTVGFYGIALILSGTAIVLSRRGRTRVATGVLGIGFVLVLFGEWLLGFPGGI